MSLLRTLPRPRLVDAWRQTHRFYAAKPAAKGSSKPAAAAPAPVFAVPEDNLESGKSCCAEGTVLVGLNWLKDQPPVIAKADEAYPEWLWTILQPTPIPNDGPGGKGERMLMRKQNRARIREQNFMNTQ
ncbi:hypothetical protein PHLGIDRAFT_116884 [Phlebiopsis gigantea 11061_1 CR5-6]|uniref:Large ribosomal subunit protein mL54 n=1 Tax=Phlebiopsis gigantea (strain 11061_1 CR5-6) TaxID=745531 RepID=A0A0C3SA48_PHLG1|nr:hypothetical protein PHLGIDRAFT_116884 [Phlebiopsis gigantea 11061_1 CR5-6]